MRTGCCKTFLTILSLLVMALLAVPAFAQNNCLQDEYNKFTGVSDANCPKTQNSNQLVCTAGDVSISTVDPHSVFILSGGQNTASGATCFQGGNFNFVADFDILTTANATNAGGRDNVGLYFANVTTNPVVPNGKGTSQALCGTCVDNIISQPHTSTGASCTPTFPSSTCFGSDNYHSNDPAPDNCGDTSSTDSSPHYGAGSEGVTIEVDNYSCSGNTSPCASDPTKQCLVMQYCTSWQTPGSSNTCFSDPTQGWPYVDAATPGTKSKCNCSTVQLPITPISVTATAQKACTTSITTGPAAFPTATTQSPTSCDEGVEGVNAATYYVHVVPTVSVGNTVVDQICDTAYGTIYDDGLLNSSNQRVFPACATGSLTPKVGTLSDSSCLTITNGSAGTCQFTAPAIGELNSVTDQVTVSGHASANPSSTFTTPQSNSVNVFSSDAPSTATVTKGFVANEAACVTVRYSVQVANTSSFDENLTLPANTSTTNTLNDNGFGDITSCAGSTNGCTSTGNVNILGTTCGVAAGIGTLHGTAGGGAFPQTLLPGTGPAPTSDGGTYSCQFDAQICSTLDTTGCFTHSNQVSAALTLEDTGAGSGLTETKNTLNLKECVTGTVQ